MERHGARVLVVDDEPDLLAEVKPLLERAGFQVLTANASSGRPPTWWCWTSGCPA
ncbi:response regulator [Thermoflexus sp.]|uniref:response regulator n=1 Tax=Thermoflexus sp. TaxID=1969742 RepID=UPI002ADDBA17|nr:response regulator [Thermoflexus sp.]